MTRKEDALLEILKSKVVTAELENLRGGSIYERKIACEKLRLLTGKDYSYLLPKEEKENKAVSSFCNKFQLASAIPFNFRKNFIVHGDTMEECIDKARAETVRLMEDGLAKIFN